MRASSTTRLKVALLAVGHDHTKTSSPNLAIRRLSAAQPPRGLHFNGRISITPFLTCKSAASARPICSRIAFGMITNLALPTERMVTFTVFLFWIDVQRYHALALIVRSRRQGQGHAVLARKHARGRKYLCLIDAGEGSPIFFRCAKVFTTRIPHQSPVP